MIHPKPCDVCGKRFQFLEACTFFGDHLCRQCFEWSSIAFVALKKKFAEDIGRRLEFRRRLRNRVDAELGPWRAPYQTGTMFPESLGYDRGPTEWLHPGAIFIPRRAGKS